MNIGAGDPVCVNLQLANFDPSSRNDPRVFAPERPEQGHPRPPPKPGRSTKEYQHAPLPAQANFGGDTVAADPGDYRDRNAGGVRHRPV